MIQQQPSRGAAQHPVCLNPRKPPVAQLTDSVTGRCPTSTRNVKIRLYPGSPVAYDISSIGGIERYAMKWGPLIDVKMYPSGRTLNTSVEFQNPGHAATFIADHAKMNGMNTTFGVVSVKRPLPDIVAEMYLYRLDLTKRLTS